MPKITKKSTQIRRKLNKERLEASVLEAAITVFREKGFPNSTIDEIAQAAGVAVGTIYNIFTSKDFLYVKAAEKIAEHLIAETEKTVRSDENPESVLKKLIKSRIQNYKKHRLFFVLFSCEKRTGAYPDPAKISKNAVQLYYSYLDICSKIFETGMSKGLFRPGNPLYGALTLEGSIDSFMGYLSGPQSNENLEDFSKNFLFIFKLSDKQFPAKCIMPPPSEAKREIYITSYDYERLNELIKVVEIFGDSKSISGMKHLEKELESAVILDNKAIPGNVVTMNSRIEIWDTATGDSSEKKLVFPGDIDKNPANISILSPMGTALLGQKESSPFKVSSEDGDRLYLIKKIIYQPESAGDYHL